MMKGLMIGSGFMMKFDLQSFIFLCFFNSLPATYSLLYNNGFEKSMYINPNIENSSIYTNLFI